MQFGWFYQSTMKRCPLSVVTRVTSHACVDGYLELRMVQTRCGYTQGVVKILSLLSLMFTSVAYVSVVIVSLLFATSVQIQAGVMVSHGRQVRGSRVCIRLSKDSGAKEVVQKAQEQMARLNCLFAASASYTVCTIRMAVQLTRCLILINHLLLCHITRWWWGTIAE